MSLTHDESDLPASPDTESGDARQSSTLPSVPPEQERPAEHIGKFADVVDADAKTVALAQDMAKGVAGSHYCVGKSPAAIAATCLYVGGLLSGDDVSQREIGRKTPVAAMSVQNRYQDLASVYAAHAPTQHQWKVRDLASNGVHGRDSADRWAYANEQARGWEDYNAAPAAAPDFARDSTSPIHARPDHQAKAGALARLRTWAADVARRALTGGDANA